MNRLFIVLIASYITLINPAVASASELSRNLISMNVECLKKDICAHIEEKERQLKEYEQKLIECEDEYGVERMKRKIKKAEKKLQRLKESLSNINIAENTNY